MPERRDGHRARTLRSGKIVFNYKGSVFDCVVRNLSDEGACLQVESTAQIPKEFALLLDGETTPRKCHKAWRSDDRVGIAFDDARSALKPADEQPLQPGEAMMVSGWQRTSEGVEPERTSTDLMRSEMLRLRAALDE